MYMILTCCVTHNDIKYSQHISLHFKHNEDKNDTQIQSKVWMLTMKIYEDIFLEKMKKIIHTHFRGTGGFANQQPGKHAVPCTRTVPVVDRC